MNKQRIITFGLIVFGLLVTVFFGARMLHTYKRFHRPGPLFSKPPSANSTDAELIRDWMTVPYVADTYETPPDVIFFSLGIVPEKGAGRKSLKELNNEYYPDQPGIVLQHVHDLIKALQDQSPPPKPLSPAITPAQTDLP
jgi:hypothetical protein